MNLIKTNWFCSLLVFITGGVLLFLCNRTDVLKILVYILGAVFTLTGCINIVASSMRHSSGKSHPVVTMVGWIAGLGGIGLGAAMLIVPAPFMPLLVYVFAALLILGGLWHFIVLSGYYKNTGLPGWLYFLPLLILVGGVVLLCSGSVRDNLRLSIIITGAGALLYGITTLLEYLYAASRERRLKKEALHSAEAVPTAHTADEETPGAPAPEVEKEEGIKKAED